MTLTPLPSPVYKIATERYIHGNVDEAKTFKLHTLTVQVDVNDKSVQDDLNSLLARQTYGLHLYRRSRYSWFPLWYENWISVMDKDDLKAFILGTTKPFNFACTLSENIGFNIGEFTSLNYTVFKFHTEKELFSVEPLIKKAIKRFMDKVISRGPYLENLRIFSLEV